MRASAVCERSVGQLAAARPIVGTTARPDCLAEPIAIVRQRSCRRSAARMTEGSVCAVTIGWIANGPGHRRVPHHVVHLVALRIACARVTLDAALDGRGDRGAEVERDGRLGGRRHVRLAQQTAAVQHMHRVAGPEPQHAHEMRSFVVRQRDDSGVRRHVRRVEPRPALHRAPRRITAPSARSPTRRRSLSAPPR